MAEKSSNEPDGESFEDKASLLKVQDSADFGSRNVAIRRPLPLLSKLQNIDLNQAPPNWLRQSGAGHYFQHSLFSRFNHTSYSSAELHPSSITLASHFPAVVGQVDVIANAKNVKKLLTLPYSQSDVSISVHRVGKTLLIDELTTEMFARSFDVEKLFPLGEMPRPSFRKKDPASSRHRSMYSKLLYYSTQDEPVLPMLTAPEPLGILLDPVSGEPPPIGDSENVEERDNEGEREDLQSDSAIIERSDEQLDHFPCVPPDPPSQPFHLNVEWIIRDIRMLLGSDLPIFGEKGQPAISLRLRDMQKPITVLTGLDYWLDNLMCNVPELAMCYHLNGIVQKYEIIKTEDIPNLDENCQFSPQEVLIVAENILSFLKSNCTQEGHTYWLFRPKGEDLVKLYDLTSLISDEKEMEVIQNPFAKSVAVLFYRLSQRMLAYGTPSSKELATVKVLLENCVKLLHNDPASQIVISSYYLLAELVLKYTPGNPSEEEEESEGSDGDDTQEMLKDSSVSTSAELPYLAVSRLRDSSHKSRQSTQSPIQPLVLGSVSDKCHLALQYISQALTNCDPGNLSGWKLKGTCQLLQKAGHAYWLLADSSMAQNSLGHCLRYSRQAILALKVALGLTKQNRKIMNGMLYSAWELCGDVHVLSTKASGSFESYLSDFDSTDVNDGKISMFIAELYNPSVEEESCLTLHTDIETSLQKGLDCYKLCEVIGHFKESSEKIKLKERIGNACNEKGVYYKQIAATLNFENDSEEMERLWALSYDSFQSGIAIFKDTGNVSNQALLHANLGSLMTSCALSCHDKEEAEFSLQEKTFYTRAVESYVKAKEILRRPATHAGIWLSIESDLAGVYYEMGHRMQKRPPLSRLNLQEIEREILSLLMKGLHHADSALESISSASPKFITLSCISGGCHHQLASLYHKMSFDSSLTSQKMKHTRTQADKHYTKALQSYLVDHHPLQIMRVYLERALMFEQQANANPGRQGIRLLHQSLENLLSIGSVLKVFEEGSPDKERSVGGEYSLNSLLAVLIQRLQAVLKQLLTLAIKRKENVDSFKEMYSCVLKIDKSAHLSVVVSTLTTLQSLAIGIH